MTMLGESTGAHTKAELQKYIQGKSKENAKMEDYEVIEASNYERSLLREANFNMKGL